MCAIINKVVHQALHTFRYSNSKSYSANFESLLKLTRHLKPTDVGLSSNCDDLRIHSFAFNAPVCYVNIYECKDFSFGVFIIRKGMCLPLHDHPGMTGVVKVLYGTLKITSYKALQGTLTMDEHTSLSKIPVAKLPDVIATSSSECQVLTPHEGNFHCIQSVGEDAAIFDILSPPYSKKRDCHYFKDILMTHSNDCSNNDKNVQYLLRIPQPSEFYCDQLSYKGPKIENNYMESENGLS